MNSSGKVITVFLVIIAVLLISLTAISLFFFQVEIDKRKQTETGWEDAKKKISVLDEELKKKEKELFLLTEKNKEADERINDLSDELELEKGLREEIKIENQSLAKQLDEEKKEKEKLREKMASNLIGNEQKIADLELKLQAEMKIKKELEEKYARLKKEYETFNPSGWSDDAPDSTSSSAVKDQVINVKIDSIGSDTSDLLEQVVPTPPNLPEGRVLTVDKDTEFVIVSIGEKEGLKAGMILSIYRGKEYLGDIQITRVQPDMSAADLIPPLTSLTVRKNDQVLVKK